MGAVAIKVANDSCDESLDLEAKVRLLFLLSVTDQQ